MGRTLLFVSLLAACGTDDPRPANSPETAAIIATEILAPTCGQVQCHSTTTMTSGYAFDTLAAAKVAMKSLTSANDHGRSLVGVIEASGGSRMPPDSPLDQRDIDLIKAWVDNGTPGL